MGVVTFATPIDGIEATSVRWRDRRASSLAWHDHQLPLAPHRPFQAAKDSGCLGSQSDGRRAPSPEVAGGVETAASTWPVAGRRVTRSRTLGTPSVPCSHMDGGHGVPHRCVAPSDTRPLPRTRSPRAGRALAPDARPRARRGGSPGIMEGAPAAVTGIMRHRDSRGNPDMRARSPDVAADPDHGRSSRSASPPIWAARDPPRRCGPGPPRGARPA
jgi:hypothetical protein